jgi:hypothetical protein
VWETITHNRQDTHLGLATPVETATSNETVSNPAFDQRLAVVTA